MENNFILTDDLLWDYADGFLDAGEKLRLDAYLRQHPAEQTRLIAILAEKRAFSEMSLEKPKADFAKQVISAWAAEQAPAKARAPAKAKGQDWVLWGIAAVMGLMLFLPFLLSPAAAPTDFSLQIPEEYMPQVQVPAFDWVGFLGSALLRNAVLLLMAFMGLTLLDKYLQVRKLRLAGQ